MTLSVNQLNFYSRKWLKFATLFCTNFKYTCSFQKKMSKLTCVLDDGFNVIFAEKYPWRFFTVKEVTVCNVGVYWLEQSTT